MAKKTKKAANEFERRWPSLYWVGWESLVDSGASCSLKANPEFRVEAGDDVALWDRAERLLAVLEGKTAGEVAGERAFSMAEPEEKALDVVAYGADDDQDAVMFAAAKKYLGADDDAEGARVQEVQEVLNALFDGELTSRVYLLLGPDEE